MDGAAHRHGGRWLLVIVRLCKVFIAILMASMTVYWLVCCPLWWSSAPRIPVYAPVGIDLADGSFVVTSAQPGVQAVSLTRLQGELALDMVSPWLDWAYVIVFLVFLGLAFWILHLLERIVNDVLSGSALSRANARRLRLIGLMTVIESLITPLGSYLASLWAVNRVVLAAGELRPTWEEGSMAAFLTGWLLILLGEVFRRGAAMREEQELTV